LESTLGWKTKHRIDLASTPQHSFSQHRASQGPSRRVGVNWDAQPRAKVLALASDFDKSHLVKSDCQSDTSDPHAPHPRPTAIVDPS
jgi:hypothetical protein